MKKALLFFGIAVMAGVVLGVAIFYYRNLRGIGPAVRPPKEASQDGVQLPDGFSMSHYATGLGKARVLGWGLDGHLWVSIADEGKILSLIDADGDGVAEKKKIIVDGLHRPHGFATRCVERGCELYVAETDKVLVFEAAVDDGEVSLSNKRVLAELPGGGNHYTRTILFMPAPNQHLLLISVGSSCNVCHEEDNRRAKILALDVNTGELREYAKGLRNSVFMAIHPMTGKIWATEMGRDLLGDDTPPDEINIIEDGKNYGWPICYGKNFHDTNFDKNVFIRNPCMEPFEIGSHIDIPAHSAPLGLAFIPEEGWPEEYWHDLLVAYHGSWNRSVPTGYKIVRYKLDAQGNYEGEEDFISGWLPAGSKEAYGRPVDIVVQPGGTIYISDDKAGVVYRAVFGDRRYTIDDKSDMIRIKNPKPNGGGAAGDCTVTGCSGQVCAEEDVMTTCEYREEYACYRSARCERQKNGECGWTETVGLRACREKARV